MDSRQACCADLRVRSWRRAKLRTNSESRMAAWCPVRADGEDPVGRDGAQIVDSAGPGAGHRAHRVGAPRRRDGSSEGGCAQRSARRPTATKAPWPSQSVTDSSGVAPRARCRTPISGATTELRDAAAGLAQIGKFGVCCGARSSVLRRDILPRGACFRLKKRREHTRRDVGLRGQREHSRDAEGQRRGIAGRGAAGCVGPGQAACGRDVDDGPTISMIALPTFLSGPPQIHVQGRVERVSNALAVDQPAPGGRLAGSSSDRATDTKSALAPNGRSLSLNASSPRSHGRAEPHARRGAGTGADHRN
jgi:hypothetical protein